MHSCAIVTVLRCVEGLDLKHHWTAGLRLSACKMAQTPLGHDPPLLKSHPSLLRYGAL